MDETLEKFSSLDKEVWAKVFYMEKSTVLAKVYLREKEVIIDDSKAEFDGKVYVQAHTFFNNHTKSCTTRQICHDFNQKIIDGCRFFLELD